MKRRKGGSTLKQFAYARKLLNADGRSKEDIARTVGFSPSVAKNAYNKIEKTEGFQNAVLKLAAESNSVLLSIITEYRLRGLSDFSNKDLNGAVNAISVAWDRINKHRAPDKNRTPEGNPLRAAVLQRVEHQTVVVESKNEDYPEITIKNKEEDPIDLDF